MKRAMLYLLYPVAITLLNIGLDPSPKSVLGQQKQDERIQASGGLEIAEVTGELETVYNSPVRLQIKSESGESAMALVTNETSLEYRGTAEPSFLQPGLLVRFVAPFYPQNLKPQAPITRLEIFRPVKKRRMSREQVMSQTPGIYPLEDAKRGRGEDNQDLPAPAGMKNFRVVGQLRAVQQDMLQIMAGSYAVLAQLDPSVEVEVTSGDTYFCTPGDQVEVSGLRNPSQAALIQAEEVAITGAKPLGAQVLGQGRGKLRGGTSRRSQSRGKRVRGQGTGEQGEEKKPTGSSKRDRSRN